MRARQTAARRSGASQTGSRPAPLARGTAEAGTERRPQCRTRHRSGIEHRAIALQIAGGVCIPAGRRRGERLVPSQAPTTRPDFGKARRGRSRPPRWRTHRCGSQALALMVARLRLAGYGSRIGWVRPNEEGLMPSTTLQVIDPGVSRGDWMPWVIWPARTLRTRRSQHRRPLALGGSLSGGGAPGQRRVRMDRLDTGRP